MKTMTELLFELTIRFDLGNKEFVVLNFDPLV